MNARARSLFSPSSLPLPSPIRKVSWCGHESRTSTLGPGMTLLSSEAQYTIFIHFLTNRALGLCIKPGPGDEDYLLWSSGSSVVTIRWPMLKYSSRVDKDGVQTSDGVPAVSSGRSVCSQATTVLDRREKKGDDYWRYRVPFHLSPFFGMSVAVEGTVHHADRLNVTTAHILAVRTCETHEWCINSNESSPDTTSTI